MFGATSNVYIRNYANLNVAFQFIDNITLEMVKRCTWGTCKIDTRYPDRLKKADGTVVSFYSFPNAKKASERREIWIRACCQGEKFVCTKDSYKISFRRLFCLSLLVALCRRKDTCPYSSSSLSLSFGYTLNKVVENIIQAKSWRVCEVLNNRVRQWLPYHE